MGKRVVLAVFGGIALLGLIVMIIGVAMGGRPGSVQIEDGSIVYASGQHTVRLTDAPYWTRNWEGRSHPFFTSLPIFRHASNTQDDPDEPDIPTGNGKTFTMGNPLPAGQTLTGLEVNIDAGYVIIQVGDEPGMTVDGDMAYTSTTDDGVWTIKSKHNSITSRELGRFWLNGKDITTTFTITVPERLLELDIKLGMGEVEVGDITVDELEGNVDLGTLYLRNVTAAESELTVNMGSIDAQELNTGICKLRCDMGGIEMTGSAATELKANCSMGSIYAMLDEPGGYTVASEVSMGSIMVAGIHYGMGLGSENHHTIGGGGPHFDLECGMGSIEIDFR
ncbi:DUF4097 domain-containing protein [Ruminococcaceae bacterium OttesenSCG-928-A11]|nr:DUF4097 domain-containing protein [Ruminococcaceae bacterium OttesenSCG-928-A11]